MGDPLDAALQAGEADQTEVDTLRQQAEGFKSLRRSLAESSETIEDTAKRTFDKVFNQDIKVLLSMSDMWKTRTPPTALDFDRIKAESMSNHANGSRQAQIQDQKELSLGDCLELFVSRYESLHLLSYL
jgi:ubiquitin-like 1-activating enzyme E1 B